jgi:hypothetical protein
MRWKRRALIFTLFSVSLALPGQALATTIAPPGKAGADQYFETLPSSGGSVAPPSGTNSGRGSHATTSVGRSRAGVARLAHLGTEGAVAAGLATATAPAAAAGSARLGHAQTNGAGGSTAGALADVLTGSDSGGLGLILPLLLATAVIATLGLAAGRLRRGGGPPEISA